MKYCVPPIGRSTVAKVAPSGRISQGSVRLNQSPVNNALNRQYDDAKRIIDEWDGPVPPGLDETLDALQRFSPLGLSKVSNLRREYSTRGRKGITRHQRHRVEDACSLLEEQIGRKYLAFFTGTLPRLTTPCTAAEWRHLIKLFRDRLIRRLTLKGLPPYVVGVFEIQMKRMEKYGELCLHLHCVFQGRLRGESWAFTITELQEVWNECLVIVFGECRIVGTMSATTNLQRVKKSAKSYLGKYLSKSGKDIQGLESEDLLSQLPSTWVMVSRPLLSLIREHSIYLTGEAAEKLVDTLTEVADRAFSWYQTIDIPLTETFTWRCGFVGRLTNFGRAIARTFKGMARDLQPLPIPSRV